MDGGGFSNFFKEMHQMVSVTPQYMRDKKHQMKQKITITEWQP